MKKVGVLHTGDELNWRGAENQIRLLIEGTKEVVQHSVAYPRKSRAHDQFSKLVPTFGLNSRRVGPIDLFRLAQFCDKHQVQIVDAHSSRGLDWALWLKTLRPRLKIVAHRRVAFPINTNFFSRRKYFSSKIDMHVAISKKIAEMLTNYGVSPELIRTIPSAVDPKPYLKLDRTALKREFCREHRLAEDALIIGNASAFTAEKGYSHFIKSLPGVLASMSGGVHFVFGGDGPLLESMKKLVQELGIEKKVLFLGHVKDTPRLLSVFDILVVPSLNEGLGTILLEGAYAGCALIGSNVGGIPEVVIDKETGLLVNPGHVHDLTKKLLQMAGDKTLRDQTSAA